MVRKNGFDENNSNKMVRKNDFDENGSKNEQ